jgi:hypothetical protein
MPALISQTPQSTIAKRKRSHPETLLSEDTEDEEEGIEETLTWADSLLFPVLGSVALVGLFLVIKYFGSEWLNLFLGVYCESSRIAFIQFVVSPGQTAVAWKATDGGNGVVAKAGRWLGTGDLHVNPLVPVEKCRA